VYKDISAQNMNFVNSSIKTPSLNRQNEIIIVLRLISTVCHQ